MKKSKTRFNKMFSSFLILLLFLPISLQSYSQKALTLEEALKVAENNSPSMKRTKLSLIRSQENLNAQNAALKSKFSLKVNPLTFSQNRALIQSISSFNTTKDVISSGSLVISQPIVFTDATLTLSNNFSYNNNIYNEKFPTDGVKFNNDLSINLDQPLFTYNKTKMNLKELQLALENTQLNYAIQLLSLEKQVAQSFYSVYQGQQSLEISKQAYENMQKSYEVSKNKVDAGLSAREELFQAELNLASSKSDFENSQVSYENAKDQFKLLVGMSLYDDLTVLPNIIVDTVRIDIAFAIDQGLKNRMELRQSQINIETSQFDLIQTKALNEFKGNLSLSFGINGLNETFTKLYNDPKNNENVNLTLDIPLWDWGEKKSRIKASEASIKSAEISFEEEQNNIILSIRQVVRNLKNLQNQIEIAKQNVTNAQLTYDLNLEKYKNGDLTGMDLNIYQNQLSEKQISYTNSLISYKLELLNLKIQTLYDFERKVPVSPVMTIEE
jgi:outer membrane protein